MGLGSGLGLEPSARAVWKLQHVEVPAEALDLIVRVHLLARAAPRGHCLLDLAFSTLRLSAEHALQVVQQATLGLRLRAQG